MPYVASGYWVSGYAVGDVAGISHFPARACIADRSLGASVLNISLGCALSESVAGTCAVADEGLACP